MPLRPNTMVEPKANLRLFASFGWTTTALHAFIHGLECREVGGLLVAGAGLVVTNAGLGFFDGGLVARFGSGCSRCRCNRRRCRCGSRLRCWCCSCRLRGCCGCGGRWCWLRCGSCLCRCHKPSRCKQRKNQSVLQHVCLQKHGKKATMI